ncbi:MAG TPA: hypothetical protein VK468_09550 [Pyrinomonadaceae bacterium]|nr:hypothetical protein [Pyrinomonadaceae bacterium]
MSTHIKQTDAENGRVKMHISGEMMLEDALLLEKIVSQIEGQNEVVIDLADLDFLDSDSGAVLRRLADQPGIRIEGMEIFLQSIVNEVEKR